MQASTEQARFFVEGVRAPITAEVAGRRRNGMVVQKDLAFLRLDTAVEGPDGRRARIARVAIAMRGDVPSLLLELTDADAPTDAEAAPEPLEPERAERESDDTLHGLPAGVSQAKARTDSTVPYEITRVAKRAKQVVVADDAPVYETTPNLEGLSAEAIEAARAELRRPSPSVGAMVRDVVGQLGILMRRPLAVR